MLLYLQLATAENIVVYDITNRSQIIHDIHATSVTRYKDSLLFTDAELNNVRLMNSNGLIDITKPGRGNDCGLACETTFGKARGLCVEFKQNIFVTDSRCGTVKILTTVSGTAEYLDNLNEILIAVSVHLKMEPSPNTSLNEAITKVGSVSQYLVGNKERIRLLTENTKKTLNGPDGNVADKTVVSVQLLHSAHQLIQKNIRDINPDYELEINMISFTTEDVECHHSTAKQKRSVPTMLEHSRDFASTVREGIKRTHPNGVFYYHTSESRGPEKTSYIDPKHNPQPLKQKFISFPRCPRIKMEKADIALMHDWANEVGKPVRQRSARQETTKKKCGTLPLGMYQRKQTINDDVPDILENDENFNQNEEEEDQVLEYDTNSDNEEEQTIESPQNKLSDAETDDSSDSDSDITDIELNMTSATYSKYSGRLRIPTMNTKYSK